MSRRSHNPGADAHRETQRLLPWLLTGTLEGAELAMVQQHLAACELCQAELAWESRLRAAGQQRAPALDPDAALDRLLPQLGRQEVRSASPGRRQRGLAANDGKWLLPVAVAQFAVIALLALLLARPGDDGAYRGLGAAPTAQGSLVVTFRPGTPEAELRRILRDNGARVVDGPTVMDAYVLAVPAPQTARVLERLRAEPAVTLAQPLASEGAP
ncbi:MAG: S8 family serine peptidase [Massilia sp.]